jgi:hypothetical protein
MPALTESVKTQAHDARRGSWLGPPLATLHEPAFAIACAKLMRLVEADITPTMVVGIRTGGLIVARAMVRAATVDLRLRPRRPVNMQSVSGSGSVSGMCWLRRARGPIATPSSAAAASETQCWRSWRRQAAAADSVHRPHRRSAANALEHHGLLLRSSGTRPEGRKGGGV